MGKHEGRGYGRPEVEDAVMDEKEVKEAGPVLENPYKKKDKNEEDLDQNQQKRRKTIQDDTEDMDIVNECEDGTAVEATKRWSEYSSEESSLGRGTMREEFTHEDKKNEKKSEQERDISKNPWETDKRTNEERFKNTATQKGYWAKIKFEISGYHTEKDKNGNMKLYTFELETIKDVLKAIMRKGKILDKSFAILPRGTNDNRRITREESIDQMIKENNKSLWLEGEIKRYVKPDGKINEIRKTIKSGFNMDMSIRFDTESLNDGNFDEFIRDWHYVARNEPNTYLFTKEGEETSKKIRIHELLPRPVQEESVEEVAYILGSTSRNQDGMQALIEELEEFIDEKLHTKIKLGVRWTTPDLGYMDLTRLWSRSRKEQDPRLRRAMEPTIMVIYMGLGNHTKKIRLDTIKVLMEEWGSFTKITTEKGRQVSQFSKLPGGNRGVLIPPIDTVTKEDKKALLTLYERHIENKVNHNLWIQTNITDMDYEINDSQGQAMTIREQLLKNEFVPGMFSFNGIIRYKDIWNEYPDKYYLITNNVTGEAATKRLELITKEIIKNDPMAIAAFQDVTVGPLTAFSKERNEPSRLQSYKFNLMELVEDDKMRLNDIIIDGKNVIEPAGLPDNLNPWNINEFSSNRTYTTAQITQSIIGMEITTNYDKDNDDLTDDGEQGHESQTPSEARPNHISQSPAGYQDTPRQDNEGFTMVRNKKDKKKNQTASSETTRSPVTTIQLNENIAKNMTGGTINVTAGNTYNLVNTNAEEEGKKEEGDSILTIGKSQSSSSYSTDSVLDMESAKYGNKEEESTSDLESIKPANLHELDRSEVNDQDKDDFEVTQLRRQFREVEALLKLKNEESLRRRRDKEDAKNGGRGGRGSILRTRKKEQNTQRQEEQSSKTKNV